MQAHECGALPATTARRWDLPPSPPRPFPTVQDSSPPSKTQSTPTGVGGFRMQWRGDLGAKCRRPHIRPNMVSFNLDTLSEVLTWKQKPQNTHECYATKNMPRRESRRQYRGQKFVWLCPPSFQTFCQRLPSFAMTGPERHHQPLQVCGHVEPILSLRPRPV